ncbi:MAG: alpha/beta fold hydrolase, partial [Bryobacterales bacterium]|nr:alpha/beta fold hydrolase [Bryobacterales bacterium]
RERDDVSRWADYALSMRAGAQLYGLGMSMGAAVLLQALPQETRFRSVVAECSYSTFRDAAAERIPRMTGVPALLSPLLLTPAFTYGRLRYGLDFDAISPLESIRKTPVPVLLIHGLADDRTSPEQSRRLAAAAPKGLAELWEVPGARHVRASEVAQQEFEDRVIRWFAK